MSPEVKTSPEAKTRTGRDFLLADLGEGLEEATIVRWLVEVGDTVELNQVLCVVETAKAEVEVPSPRAGRIEALGGVEGETLAVGALLVHFEPEPDAAASPSDDQPDAAASPSDDQPDAAASPSDDQPGPAAQPRSDQPTRQPTLVGYGHDASIDRSRRSARPRRALPNPRKPITKPPVRLLARRLGIDLADLVPGSGPGGVVTRSDVEAAAEAASHQRGRVADRPGAEAASRQLGGVADRQGADTRSQHKAEAGATVPVTGVRARIAEHLSRSRAEIPDATASVVADCTRLLEVRRQLNAGAERRGLDPHITPFSLLCRFVVVSLSDVPILNSTFQPGAGDAAPEILLHDDVHLGIGTATDRGLLVTVAHHAQARSVHDLSGELARLAEGARAGNLTPAELTGSTFTVSNFGALGLDDGVPIINHPEAAILGVGSIKARPHVVDGEVVARPTVSLTLAFDHRVCDGAEAARFLTGLRDLVEAPELALLTS